MSRHRFTSAGGHSSAHARYTATVPTCTSRLLTEPSIGQPQRTQFATGRSGLSEAGMRGPSLSACRALLAPTPPRDRLALSRLPRGKHLDLRVAHHDPHRAPPATFGTASSFPTTSAR